MLSPLATRIAALRARTAADLAAMARPLMDHTGYVYTAVEYGMDQLQMPADPGDEVALVALVGAIHAMAAHLGEDPRTLGREVHAALAAMLQAEQRAQMLGCTCDEEIAMIRDTCDNH